MVAGMIIPSEPLTSVGSVAIAVYFAAKLSLGRDVNGKIRKAMQSNAVQINGNKMSFGNPLRIGVPK
jgi:hypothetical protein